ncbi:MAG: hypothetical protein KME60_19010 [Cyanomargarita calcarea GSE-NOS-MK-12-04C]|uniref:Uncharacterized protein n=1 Tax=Cyanomargarita calcarea GSE-NOS-MK-12-04C TaxID=2839659 RepID=A0A951QQS8_9CYAN|nr:hypothetical protein [Cyanomargarita calcarea GSE-NOS-MK-12-04C]
MTVLGWVAGGFASLGLEKAFVETLTSGVLAKQEIWYSLARYLSNGVFAAIFGADQALLLRQYVSGWLWMLATTAGWLVCNSVSAAWINYISFIASSSNTILSAEEALVFGILSTLAYIISGIWLGFFQWIVLRRYVTGAWWWNFLPSFAFTLISILVYLLSLVQDFIPEAIRSQIIYLSGQGFTALILGVIPAIGLCNLKISSNRTTEV